MAICHSSSGLLSGSDRASLTGRPNWELLSESLSHLGTNEQNINDKIELSRLQYQKGVGFPLEGGQCHLEMTLGSSGRL